ncbi:hypothetical protein HY061_00805 [Candidatus Azambacteria bacterium]|nr:hypothetical protein [Candidatus Azambacteria bacterium]
MDEDPNKTHDFSAQIGARISDEIEKLGGIVAKQLFIDNFHPDPKSFKLDVDKYVLRLGDNGFTPHVVMFETDLELPAKNILHTLNGKTHRKEEGVFLTEKNIQLMSGDRPSCNLLDASLYVAKLSMFQLSITILPLSWKDQQKNVMRILGALGYTRLPIVNVFYDENERISMVFQ